MELLIPFTIFIVGFLASILNATVGGGGLFAIPSLMFIGLPPHMAIATERFGNIGTTVGGIWRYYKSGNLRPKLAFALTIIALIAGYIGANIVIALPAETVRQSISFILLAFLPIIILKKNVGVIETKPSRAMLGFGGVAYFLSVLYGATFAAGAGTLILYSLIFFFGYPIIVAKSASMVAWFFQILLTVAIFLSQDLVHLYYGAILIVANFIGAYVGASMAIKKGNAWIKWLFVVVVFISAVKLLFF